MEGWQIALVVVGTIYLGVWLLIYFNTRHEVDPKQLVALVALLPLVGLVTLIVSIVRACANSASVDAAQTARRAREARLRSEAEGLIGALWSPDREAGVQTVVRLFDRLETAERLSLSSSHRVEERHVLWPSPPPTPDPWGLKDLGKVIYDGGLKYKTAGGWGLVPLPGARDLDR